MGFKSLLALVLVLAAGVAGASERTREQTFTYTLLTSDDLPYVVMAAKAVSRTPTLAPDVLDVTAALLAERAAARNTSRQDIDASAWLIRALGAGKQARHRSAIEQAVAAYQDDKIGKYAEIALAGMTEGDATPPPAIDLATLRAQLQAEREAMPGSNPSSATGVDFGAPLESVLTQLGYPNGMVKTTRTAGYSYVKITSHAMRFDYDALGMLEIGDGSAAGHVWVVTRFWPKLADYTGEYPFEATAVTNGSGREMLDVAMSMESAGVREPQLLDIVANRIRRSMDSGDAAEVKALAYLCRLLGASKDHKHAPLLQEVADKGGDNALRRHAKRGLDELFGQ